MDTNRKQTAIDWAKKWNHWFWQTSKLTGAPILLCLILVAFQKLFFTATCNLAGYQCDESFGSASHIVSQASAALAPSSAEAQTAEDGDVATINLQGFPPDSRKRIEDSVRIEAQILANAGRGKGPK